jgi:hypothetical protein
MARYAQISALGRPGAKFFTEAPNICRSSVWNLLRATLLASKILGWFLGFWKICGPLLMTTYVPNFTVVELVA